MKKKPEPKKKPSLSAIKAANKNSRRDINPLGPQERLRVLQGAFGYRH